LAAANDRRKVPLVKPWLPLLSIVLAFGAFAQNTPVIDSISPGSGPSTGGTEVTITGNNLLTQVACILPCPTTVTFGEITVPVKSESPRELVVITPAHPIGTVDVTVEVAGVPPVTRENGFTFTATADDSHELVLLPIHLDGILHGAFGAQWRTDLWLRNNGSSIATLAPWSCPPDLVCLPVFPLTFALHPGRSLHNLPPLFLPPDGNPSRLLFVLRPFSDDVSYNLRFADVSRFAIDGGAEMPVVRESELLTRPAQLHNIPLGPSFRVLLRIYDVEYGFSDFRVSIYPQSEDNPAAVHQAIVRASSPYVGSFRPKASYGFLDITGLLVLEKVWPATARIEIEPLTPGSRFWAFASITSNETQIVTLVTPQ
jgi:hypothetical protein